MMIGRARTAAKFFVYGLITGLLFAPRSGAETRAYLIDWASSAVKSVLAGGSSAGNSQQ